MADAKTLEEPALRGALNRTPPPSTVPVWDPWKEEAPHERTHRVKVDPKREPPITGAIPKELPATRFVTWDPWSHGLPNGVTPPEGYRGASHSSHDAASFVPPASGRQDSGRRDAGDTITLPLIKVGENVPPLARRMSRLGTETAFDVLARVKKLQAEGKSVLSFALGEPDFDTPTHVRESAKKALDEGQTHYGPSAGLDPLRKSIAKYISRSRKISVDFDQVVVGPGAKPVLFDAMMALVDEGDEVIYPNPGYPIYESVADFLGAKSVPLPLTEAKQFRFDLNDLAKVISPKTKLLVVNTPANPTGGVLTKEDLAGVAELARKHNFWIIADEIYSEILYIPEYASILQHAGMAERTVLIDGFSKTFAMTGWRLGYGVMPKALVPHVARIETNVNSCTCTFAQLAAIDALDGPWTEAHRFRDEFEKRRDLIVAGLNAIKGVSCLKPDGAFYVFPNVTQACKNLGLKDSREFQDKALSDAGVAVLARTCFGRKNPGEEQEYIRLSYATSQENIREGLKRLKAFCEK
ncbi:MAG TPA: pyridoxal phosphate-dependent aminotransferase [Planctomycetota bacterium]|nr:pyridoxal phosphate-dependent aminotransferase [Planctomycetota bacterium]